MEEATRVGTMVMTEGLYKDQVNDNKTKHKNKNTYKVVSCSSRRRAERLVTMNEDECTWPPCTLTNIPKLSRTMVMAEFHSAFGLEVGSTSGFCSRWSLMNSHLNGALGKRRTIMPIGMETTPRVGDMPHSQPPMRVTWKAAPLMKTIRTCTAISVEE